MSWVRRFLEGLSRRPLVVMLLVAFLPATASWRSRSFFSPDEVNYLQVAREMVERRDVVLPTLDGQPWLNKPPLAHWLLALAYSALGWNFAAAVVLNTLLGALTAWLIALHGARSSREEGLSAGIIYLTMFLPQAVMRSGLTDGALLLCTTAAVLAVLWQGPLWPVAAGGFLGLAMLVKGPVGPLVVLPALAGYLAVRRPPHWLRSVVVVGLTAVATVAPWLVALAARGYLSQLIHQFLLHEVVSRAVDEWKIAAPPWMVLIYLAVGAFPWGFFLVLSRGGARQALHTLKQPERAAEWAAFLVPLVAFMAARGKLPHYVLPVLPWLALAVARTLRAPSPNPKAWWFAGILVASLPLAASAALQNHAMRSFLPPWFLPALLGFAVAALGFRFLKNLRTSVRVAWVVGFSLVLRLLLDLGVLPFLEKTKVERLATEALARHAPPNGQAIAHGRFRETYFLSGIRGWLHTQNRQELETAFTRTAEAGKTAFVVAFDPHWGDVFAAAGNLHAGVQRRFTVSGWTEREFEPAVIAGFLITDEGLPQVWFFDFDRPLEGADGFFPPEGHRFISSFQWIGKDARLPLILPPPSWRLSFRVWGLSPERSRQTISLSLGPCPLGSFSVEEQAGVFSVGSGACNLEGRQWLTLQAARTVVPARANPGSHDPRELAVAWDWLVVEPGEPAPTGTPP